MESEPPAPKWLRNWLGDEYFVTPVGLWVTGPVLRNARIEKQLTDEKLAQIIDAMPDLKGLGIWRGIITDDGCLALGRLRRLEHIQLADSDVLTDAALAGLANNQVLKQVELFRCPQFTWGVVKHLDAARDTLTLLHLSGNGFGDDGIDVVEYFPKLATLDLIDAPVSDQSIPLLSKLSTLSRLEINNTRISQDGFDQIKRALPNCKVIYIPKPRPKSKVRRELGALRRLLGSASLATENHAVAKLLPVFCIPLATLPVAASLRE